MDRVLEIDRDRVTEGVLVLDGVNDGVGVA